MAKVAISHLKVITLDQVEESDRW